MKDKIGVITMGSLFVKVHSYDVLNPRLMNKYCQGGIIGWEEMDTGITLNA